MYRNRVFSVLLCLALLLALSIGVFAASAPDAPELTVTQLAGRFTLDWTLPKSGGSPVTGYAFVFYPTSEGVPPKWTKIAADTNTYTTPELDNYGEEYTFLIHATNAVGDSADTKVIKKLLHKNDLTVNTVRDRIQSTSFSASLQEAASPTELKAFLEKEIAAINSTVKVEVKITSFEQAQLTQVGTFQFTATVSLGNPNEPSYASTVTDTIKGVISSSGKLSTPKITVSTAEEGGLAYRITTTGTAAQAEFIQSFKVSVIDALTDQAIVSDYTINAAEKTGVIPLASGMKGENSYRVAIKACSSDSMKYLDSDLSEPSSAAAAGRIQITVRPSVTEKYYGDTEPIFGYEIVKGPDPLPTGVDLKLTFTRAAGSDAGTYDFSFQQTDTNYLVTLDEGVVFTIRPRPLTIRPKDREVIYEEGTTFLLSEIGEVEGLVAGDQITELDFNSEDARGEVGEFEISAARAVITSGDTDVTKNYSITYAPGKLIIHPIGYSAEHAGGGLQLWVILVIIAGVLLLAAAGVLVFLLVKRRKEQDQAIGEEIAAKEEPDSTDAPSGEGYEDYLEIIDMNAVEQEAENTPSDAPSEDTPAPDAPDAEPLPLSDPETQATIEEIENAQAKTSAEDE